jgi:phosphohistidine phosphatase
MTIYFLRHADAEDLAASDFDRKLTAKGLEQATKVGKFSRRNGIVPDAILTSPLLRARQTAEIVGELLDITPVVVDWLACGMQTTELLAKLAAYRDKASIMLVGHEPDISSAISDLIGLTNLGGMLIRKASLSAIDLPYLEESAGQLEFSIPSRLM